MFLPTFVLLVSEIHKEAIILVDVNDVNYWKGNTLALEANFFNFCFLSINTHYVHDEAVILM